MYSGLLQFSPRDGTDIWPDLATDWDISSDGLTRTFKIDPRVTQWNDGTPFDVEDIVFAYKRWINPPTGIIQPRAGGLRVIDPTTIKKVDDTTFQFGLKFPFGDVAAEAANGWRLILPRHILKANDNTLTSPDQIIGTGPSPAYHVTGEGSFDTPALAHARPPTSLTRSKIAPAESRLSATYQSPCEPMRS